MGYFAHIALSDSHVCPDGWISDVNNPVISNRMQYDREIRIRMTIFWEFFKDDYVELSLVTDFLM